jgi:HEXXH motif-containing protein
MDLERQCLGFINAPFPLWEVRLTTDLVRNKWRQLNLNPSNYNTTNIWHQKELMNFNQPNQFFLEDADFIHLATFYIENGLEPMRAEEIAFSRAKEKLHKATTVLNLVPECVQCVTMLVKAIQVLKQPAPEFDVSYSHPDIPFTIFVSVDVEDTAVATLRLAESILHEAMHLKLTLIEQICPLIQPGTNAKFFSPWRNEKRPVNGVLHGLFVFKAINDFYKMVLQLISSFEEQDFCTWRMEEIEKEFSLIKSLPANLGLTPAGASLSAYLLPSS